MYHNTMRFTWFCVGLTLALTAFSCSKSTNDDNGGDVVPPTVSVTYPANGSEVSCTVIVTAEASDNVGVTKVEFYIDGQLRHTDTSSPWSYSWNCDGYAGGSQHTVYAKAYDAVGNSSSSSVVQVTVDAQEQNRPPSSPSNPSPTSNSCGISRGAYLTWGASDPDGDPLTYDVYFGTSSNPSLRQSSLTTNSCKITDIYSVSYDIEYYWKIVVKDDHQHETVGSTWHFTTEAAEGVPYYYYIEDIWWSDEIDNDGDLYTSYRKLHFNVNVSCGTHNVYAEIWEGYTGSWVMWLYLTTSDFAVTGVSASDAYSIDVGLPNNELSHGVYNFNIDIYESGVDSVVASDGLMYSTFETAAED